MNYLKSRALFNGNLGSCSYFSPDGGCFQHIGLLQMWTWRWKSSIVLPQSISWERAQMTSWWESTDLKLLFRLFCHTSGAFFFFFFLCCNSVPLYIFSWRNRYPDLPRSVLEGLSPLLPGEYPAHEVKKDLPPMDIRAQDSPHLCNIMLDLVLCWTMLAYKRTITTKMFF